MIKLTYCQQFNHLTIRYGSQFWIYYVVEQHFNQSCQLFSQMKTKGIKPLEPFQISAEKLI